MNAKFTVRSEVDFIALAPVVLGFQPEHSLVMMTVDSFHARIDLPEESEVEYVVEALLTPAQRHNVGRVAFAIFDDGDHPALQAALLDGFQRADIQVLAAVLVGDGRYRRFGEDEWQPLDLTCHPYVLEAQYLDVAPKFDTREAMAASIQPCGEGWTEPVIEAVYQLRQRGVENVITSLTRQRASEAVELWSKALRGSESGSDLTADIALVLAFAAWLSGHGALAWEALELADYQSTWHEMLTIALDKAVSPEGWPFEVSDD